MNDMNKDEDKKVIREEKPFNILNEIGISEDFDDLIDEEQVYKTVSCGKPAADDWFRLFPPKSNSINGFIKGVVTTQKDAKNRKQIYLVGGSQSFKNTMMKKLKPSTKTVIAYGVTSTKHPFIWPINYGADKNAWQKTAMEAAINACTQWTKIAANMANQENDMWFPKAQNIFPEIDISNFPTYAKAIELAFEGRIITSTEHFAYKKAIGEVI